MTRPAPGPVLLASTAAGLSVAAQVGGKALRDALFLSSFPIEHLPRMVIAAAVVSILAAAGSSRAFRSMGPRRTSAALFGLSAGAMLCLAAMLRAAPGATALLFYLHLAVFGALLLSGLWSTVSEAFDPSSARKQFATIASGATAGGLCGGLLAERVAAWSDPTTMFVVIAALQAICAFLVLRLRPIESEDEAPAESSGLSATLRRIGANHYLVLLGALVVGAALLENIADYLLKAAAAESLDQAELMRFFGVFYTVVGVTTLVLQVLLSRRLLERFGPSQATASLPSLGLVGVAAMLAVPTLPVAAALRGALAASRNSLFRSGYELFFAPIPNDERRATKSLVDVASERAGDIVAGLAISIVLFAAPQRATLVLCVGALGIALGILWLARRLHSGYVRTLESQLLDRGSELAMTQTIVRSNLLLQTLSGFGAESVSAESKPTDEAVASDATEPDVLANESFESASVPELIELLAQDQCAQRASARLIELGTDAVEPLTIALATSTTPYPARRRIPRLLAEHPSPGVTDALMEGLNDRRFEVRLQCSSTLFGFARAGTLADIDRERVYGFVDREVTVGRRLWEMRSADAESDSSLVDPLLTHRADRSLQHIIQLLSLIHPIGPLRVAFRGLHTDDPMLRGTALEYLLTVLPHRTHTKLRLVLGDDGDGAGGGADSSARALESLLASQASIDARIEALGTST